MSTHILTLSGKKESHWNRDEQIVIYEDKEVHFTRFYGGVERGASLQITIAGGDYIQLNNSDVMRLIELLNATFKG